MCGLPRRRSLPLNLHTNQWSSITSAIRPWRDLVLFGFSHADQGLLRNMGSGVLEYDQKTGKWDRYDDPTERRRWCSSRTRD